MPRNPNVPNPEFGGLHTPVDPWLYSREMVRALETASVLHAAQSRKFRKDGDGNPLPGEMVIPYVAHLMAVSSIVLDHGGSEQEAIAGLLHDVLEDIQPRDLSEQVVRSFGDEVYAIVDGCTDGVPDEHGTKEPWRLRKERYLEHMRGASRSVLLVAAADKLHNARSTVADLRRLGPDALTKYNAAPADTLWYYSALVHEFTVNTNSTKSLIDELRLTVAEMWSLAGR